MVVPCPRKEGKQTRVLRERRKPKNEVDEVMMTIIWNEVLDHGEYYRTPMGKVKIDVKLRMTRLL